MGFDGSRAFLKERTGTENYSYQLLKALAKIDKKNKYIVYLRTQGLTLQGWPKNLKFVTIEFPKLWTQIGLAKQTFQDRLDVLFIPAHTSPLIHRPGLKTVVTVHDLGAEYLPKMHQLKQRVYLRWITKYQLKSATKLIAVSKATKEDLIKKVGINPKKIEVVYEGYNNNLFKSVKDDALSKILRYYDIEKGKYFLFVGTVQPRKNLERIIRAFHKFLTIDNGKWKIGVEGRRSKIDKKNILSSIIDPQNTTVDPQSSTVKLVIAGSRGWLSDEIYKLPKKLRIENQVKFLGHVDDKDLLALYSGAIALTFPSLFEGFGLPILEAQACSCPVITSNISSMPEVAGKGAILVDPYSIDDIVKGIKRLMINDERLRIIKLGFENIKRFSWEKCAMETLAVLESL